MAPDRFKSGYFIYAGEHGPGIHDFAVMHFSHTKAINEAMTDRVQ